jgi:uncharacterized protein (DUF169 family)
MARLEACVRSARPQSLCISISNIIERVGKIVNYINDIKRMGMRMRSILGMSSSSVGVRLLDTNERVTNAEILEKHRYCQALMKARHGHNVILNRDNVSCPAAANAFGFRPLPDGLSSGNGLVGFGIVSGAKVGQKMFQHMPALKPGQVKQVHLYPLELSEYVPDIVVVEDEVEKLMWLVLANLHATGGERVMSSTAVLQAACVDATVIPYLENRMNFSYGCYGCRDATDIGNNETVLGFPAALLSSIMENLEYLNKKAMPASRSKNALASMQKKGSKDQE